MPGNVTNASIGIVMPWALARSFARAQPWKAKTNIYADGETQISLEVATSRKSWDLGLRLSPASLATLAAFWVTTKGPVLPFWFYDVWESVPKFSYDASGTATDGRYAVRFDGSFSTERGWPRHDVTVRLIEIT